MDTITKIQVGDDPPMFQSLTSFVQAHELERVTWEEARVVGRYTVIAFKNGAVLKCFVAGTSRPNQLRVSEAHRGETRRTIHKDYVLEIYQ